MECQLVACWNLGHIQKSNIRESELRIDVLRRLQIDLISFQIFNASHMAPFDVPHVTHDMILRFMGVNFTAIMDGSARIPSSIGTTTKPLFVEEHDAKPSPTPSKTPQQDKAMWEAYYNAGSAALVLVLVFLVIGTFVWCRLRRKRSVKLPFTQAEGDAEESIPLNSALRRDNGTEEDVSRQRKGKDRMRDTDTGEPPIFDVGDSDDEDYKHTTTNK